jgi:hypothetical protein
MTKLYEMMKITIYKDESDVEMNLIVEIIMKIIVDSFEAYKIIIESTDFIDKHIHLLNTIPLNKIKERYLNSFDFLSY